MTINDKDAIELAISLLEANCINAAEPLWDLDDYGNPILAEVGCVRWVFCKLFEIQDEPEPRIERDEQEITVIVQAKVKWSHWDNIMIREFFVSIVFEDEKWEALSDYDWEDVDIYEKGPSF